MGARRADCLLHRGELAVEDARAGDLLDVAEQAGAQSGQRLELVATNFSVALARLSDRTSSAWLMLRSSQRS